MKKKILILLLCWIIVMGLAGCGTTEKKANITDNNGKKVKMTSKELINVYEENDEKFNSLYGNAHISFDTKVIKVSDGEIILDDNYIIEPHQDFNNLSKVDKGDKLTIDGTIKEIYQYDGKKYIYLNESSELKFEGKNVKNDWVYKMIGIYDCGLATFEVKNDEDINRVIVIHTNIVNDREATYYPTFDNENEIMSFGYYWKFKLNDEGNVVQLNYNDEICKRLK